MYFHGRAGIRLNQELGLCNSSLARWAETDQSASSTRSAPVRVLESPAWGATGLDWEAREV
ncbi:hypothetical protein PG994_007695 [Apiospora phragmitis]|uniref:Transposase n=1 Tax=Apiospora phragmitis TaxID=2905665 RepID=A0ABR1UQY9_9PEZI